MSVTTGGYSYIYWNGLAVTGKNITIEYGTTFTNNITMAVSITAGAGTAVAGNMRLGMSMTASP